jgi:hypothetical protein
MLVCFLVFYRLMGKHLALLTDVVSGFKSMVDSLTLVDFMVMDMDPRQQTSIILGKP